MPTVFRPGESCCDCSKLASNGKHASIVSSCTIDVSVCKLSLMGQKDFNNFTFKDSSCFAFICMSSREPSGVPGVERGGILSCRFRLAFRSLEVGSIFLIFSRGAGQTRDDEACSQSIEHLVDLAKIIRFCPIFALMNKGIGPFSIWRDPWVTSRASPFPFDPPREYARCDRRAAEYLLRLVN